MKRKKMFVIMIASVLVIAILLCGCNEITLTGGKVNEERVQVAVPYELNLSLGEVRHYLHYNAESIWCEVFDGNTTSYYEYDIYTGTSKKLGSFSCNGAGGIVSAVAKDGVYTYVIEKADNAEKNCNQVIFLSYEKEKAVKISKERVSSLMPMEYNNGEIYILTSSIDNDSDMGTTALERMNTKGRKKKVLISAFADKNNKEGGELICFDISGDSLYIYYLDVEGNGNGVGSIRVYDLDGNFQKDISLSNLTADSLKEGCTGIEVRGDFIYLENKARGEGVIGRICDGEVEEVVVDKHCGYAESLSENELVVWSSKSYNYDKNKIYVCNEKKGTVKEYSLDLEDGEYINDVLTNDNSIMIVTMRKGVERILVTHIDSLGEGSYLYIAD